MSTIGQLQRAPRVSLALAAVISALAAGLSGCRPMMLDDEMAVELSTPSKRHAVAFATEPEMLYVEVAPGGQGLSPNQQADVLRFVERYKAESTGALRIASPKGAGGHLAISNAARQLEGIVRDAGVNTAAIEASRYSHEKGQQPVLRLAYDRTLAVAPQCADWGTDLGENRERIPYNNFGCATQRNFALNVANARDIMEPRAEAPRSSERRSSTWSQYVNAMPAPGGATSSTGAADPAAAPPAAPSP